MTAVEHALPPDGAAPRQCGAANCGTDIRRLVAMTPGCEIRQCLGLLGPGLGHFFAFSTRAGARAGIHVKCLVPVGLADIELTR